MKWQINIQDFQGGYAPNWWKSTYPTYGNKNMAGAMQNADITNPNVLTQGPGLANLTNGTEAGVVSTLIKGILKVPTATNVGYAVGGNKLYQINATTVASGGSPSWPRTITDNGSELGEDVVEFQGNLYYSYNQTGSVGDIGKYDLASTFDDDWGSTVPTGAAALQSAPHQMIAAGNDTMYIANGLYVASYDGTTFTAQALDLPTGSVISSIAWSGDRLWIAANRPNLTGSNTNKSSIYSWDGTTSSWDDEIVVNGLISALYVKNGTIFVWYADITSTGGYKLGYVNGSSITDLENFTGGLPEFYQITTYQDFLIWNSAGLIFAWGSGGKDLPTRLFQLADGGYTTIGGISALFGTVLVASTQSTSYKLAKFSGYDTACNWKSLLFDITGGGRVSSIDFVRINIESMSSGALVDWKLLNDQGTTIYNDTISFSKNAAKTSIYYPLNGKVTDNFRLEFDWTNGSATNPVKIKSAKIYGTN